MSTTNTERLKTNRVILLVSIVPMFIHTSEHLLAGSYFPLLFFLLLLIIFISLWSFKIVKTKAILKLWSLLLIGYGFIRIALVLLIIVAQNGVPSDIYYQLDIWFFIITIFIISIGIWVLRHREELKLI